MADYINKVVYGGETLIDLTADTITASDLLSGVTAHDKSGAPITGSCTYDADTSDATASAPEILLNKTAYVDGDKITGSMPNNGAVTGTISTKAGQYTVPRGYHDGTGKVSIASAEQAKIVAGNIKQGITILGVVGTYSGEGVQLQAKSVTPYTDIQQVITADAGYDALSQVTVAKISYVEVPNAAGGLTATIGDKSTD